MSGVKRPAQNTPTAYEMAMYKKYETATDEELKNAPADELLAADDAAMKLQKQKSAFTTACKAIVDVNK